MYAVMIDFVLLCLVFAWVWDRLGWWVGCLLLMCLLLRLVGAYAVWLFWLFGLVACFV